MRSSLLSSLFYLLLFLVFSILAKSDYSRHYSSIKLKCFQCNSPFGCTSGHCYGDVCVKTAANDLRTERYVVKGCENMTRSVTTDIYEPQMKHKSYCKTEIVLGIDTTICYCRDGDYCNTSPAPIPILVYFLIGFILL